jgi:hypothetical protein
MVDSNVSMPARSKFSLFSLEPFLWLAFVLLWQAVYLICCFLMLALQRELQRDRRYEYFTPNGSGPQICYSGCGRLTSEVNDFFNWIASDSALYLLVAALCLAPLPYLLKVKSRTTRVVISSGLAALSVFVVWVRLFNASFFDTRQIPL